MVVIILLAISSIYTDFCTESPENILFKPFVNMIFLGLAALVRFLRLATISGFSILVIFLIFSICESNFSLNSLCFCSMREVNWLYFSFSSCLFWPIFIRERLNINKIKNIKERIKNILLFLFNPTMPYIKFIIHNFIRPPFWLKFLIIPDNFSLLVIFLVKNIKNPKV